MTRQLNHLAAVIGVVALIVGSSSLLDARAPLTQSADRGLYLRSGGVAKALAMSFDVLASDVYWLRTIQHFGGDRLSGRRDKPFELLYPLLDLTTTLDPHFNAAYRFGAMFLSEPVPGGPGRPDLAIALLEKGLRAQPGKWQYAQDIGFVHLWSGGDPKDAAMWFHRAAGMPGAPIWLEAVAATAMADADRAVARAWLEDMAQHSSEAWVRSIADRRLAQLRAMEDIEHLEALVPSFQQQMKRNPRGWDDFMAAGLLRGVPVDPAGAPYEYFPDSGLVRLDKRSPLSPLPTMTGRAR